jgi:hypothetical protein
MVLIQTNASKAKGTYDAKKAKKQAKIDGKQRIRDLGKASLYTPGGAAAGGAFLADHDSQDMDVDSATAAAASSVMQSLGVTQQGRRDGSDTAQAVSSAASSINQNQRRGRRNGASAGKAS